jgi:glycosyltransferase involved in cell wall biosynthesis
MKGSPPRTNGSPGSVPERALLLSYAFPPMWVPEAVLSAKCMASMPGFQVDVVCAEPFGQWDGGDPSLTEFVHERFRTIDRVSMPKWALSRPVRRSETLSRTPDEFRFMNRRVFAKVRSLDLRAYAVVVTWSQWHSIHLIGPRVRRLPGSPPWIAHFSDPWVDNPLAPLKGVSGFLNRRLERKVVEGADHLVVTAEETRRLFVDRYGDEAASKTTIVPHTYLPDLYPERRPQSDDAPLLIRYVGQMYGARSPEPLFRALGVLATEDREMLNDVRVELIGRVDPEMLQTDAALALPDGLVRIVSPVEYLESLGLVRQADLLLVIDAPMASSPFLPSKLVDYLGAARPVLGITPPGASANLIQRLGGWVARPDNPEEVRSALATAVEWVRTHDREADFGDAAVRAEYAAARVGPQMTEIVREASRR